MTTYDAVGAEIDDDGGSFVTADSTADERIHVHHLAAIRLGKAALVAAIEAGAVLQEERSRRGNDFGDWVNAQLVLTLGEADFYMRFYEESPVRPEQLSAAVEVKLPRVLELLGQLGNAFAEGAVPLRPTKTTKRTRHSQPKPTVSDNVDNTPRPQAPESREATSCLVKASDRAKKRTASGARKAELGRQDRKHRQSALTAEQRQFLVRRSPRLFAQVRKGELQAEEALRRAKDLPDRSSPKRSQ